MKRRTTFSRTLVVRFTLLVSLVFLVVLSVTVFLNVRAVKKQSFHAHTITLDAMIEEGLTLVRNNSITSCNCVYPFKRSSMF